MDRMEEILEIVREIREDVSFMKHHRNMLCGMPILEVDEVCDLLIVNCAVIALRVSSSVSISVVV